MIRLVNERTGKIAAMVPVDKILYIEDVTDRL